jgi:hypothetical protein
MSIDTTSQAVTAGQAKLFLGGAGLVIDELTGSRVTGHIELGPEHHTPPKHRHRPRKTGNAWMRTQTAPLAWDVFVAPAELTVIDDLAPGAQYQTWSPITAALITERKSP